MADDQFPEDIIYGIFSRLPVKSLARFRCVCKSWLEYINHPYLKTIHLKQELTPIIFPKNHKSNISFLRVNETMSTVKKDLVFEFCCEDYSKPHVLGSCNGLTLVGYDRSFLALINLVTKQRLNLPPFGMITSSNHHHLDQLSIPVPASAGTGIGFDESTNTFKTVCVILKEPVDCSPDDIHLVRQQLRTMVHYSGTTTNSWREITQNPAYPITGGGVFAHGRLHWFVDFHNYWSFDEGTQIVWFDVKTERFGLTDCPKQKGGYRDHDRLVDLDGEVGIAYIDQRIDLWILKKEDYWVLHCRFDLCPSPYNKYTHVAVSGFWNEEGDVLLSSDHGRRLLVYTLKTGDLREYVVDSSEEFEADIRMCRTSLFSFLECS
ncbi:hypothetical protein SSX86_019375 [Deinandra increscens subsp. villosa]|uniref:F-box domain-containing protein n=1 Tax=Deinandra increscens subsp. villosa TaxID=3103831 RepID=A0AAP0GVK5_9ASTR